MKRMMLPVCAVVAVGLFCGVGCSREDREDAINRVGTAAKVLNGEVRANDVEQNVPNIVVEQQRKERIRQNTTWTADNRALHPIEYCQAQLEDLKNHAARLEVTAHEVATKKAEVTREKGNNEGKLSSLGKFLDEAKATYRKCEADNSWPATLGGFALSKEKLQEKIVDAAKRIPAVETRVATLQNQLVQLEKKAALVVKEQQQLADLRERIEATIGDLKLKKVIDGQTGIADSLNAINDAMGSLGAGYDDPSIDDILGTDRKSSVKEDFNKIMSE